MQRDKRVAPWFAGAVPLRRAVRHAEEVVRQYPGYVIVRPSWIYGRRDLVSLPRVPLPHPARVAGLVHVIDRYAEQLAELETRLP